MQKRKKTRKEKIAEQQKEKNKKIPFDKVKFFVGLLFFIGAGLTVFEIMIFRRTVIKWQIPFLIWLTTGIVSTVAFSKIWKINIKDEFGNSSKFWTLFYNCLTFGGITIFTLMFINFKSLEINIETHKLKILKKSTMRGKPKRIPLADVEFKGLIKTIIFTSEEKKKLENAEYIELKTKRGNLGFDVIVEKRIIE